MLLAAVPAAHVLKAALFKRRQKEALRVLIVLLCLAFCRRGRRVVSFSVCKIASPVSFLLWCLGATRRRDENNLLRADDLGPHRQRRGWRGALGRRQASFADGTVAGRDTGDEGTSDDARSAVRLAALGEAGRLAAFDKLGELQQEGACCDVTLAVGGQNFKAHKCVLAAQSFPLRAMFEGAFKEGNESVIVLRDVEPLSFALLLDFLYDRSVNITSDNVEALLDLSARYGVSLLRRVCCAFLAQSVNPSNACSLLAVADRYDCRRLRRDLLAYTLERFCLACCATGADGFCQLSLALVSEVLKDDRLATWEKGEVSVFWAAVSWLGAERSRRHDADEVLSHVRFGLIFAKTIADSVESHPLLQTKAGKTFVHEAYRYQALPLESRQEFAESMAARARPRAAPALTSAAAGGSGGKSGAVRRGLGAVRLDHDGSRSNENGDGDEKHDGEVWNIEATGIYSQASGGGSERRAFGEQRQQHSGSAPCDVDDGSGVHASTTDHVFGGAEELVEEGKREGEDAGERGKFQGAPRKAMASPTARRRSWGAGLRMYV